MDHAISHRRINLLRVDNANFPELKHVKSRMASKLTGQNTHTLGYVRDKVDVLKSRTVQELKDAAAEVFVLGRKFVLE